MKAPPMTGSQTNVACRRAGATLIEITMVVLIIGILTSVATPKYFRSLAYYRAETAARRVANDLRLAREHAQKTSVPQTVDFNVVTDDYVIPTLPDPDHPSTTCYVQLRRAPYSVDLATAAFASGDALTFDIFGRPNNPGSLTVRSGSQIRTVQVDDAGGVSIQ
jgi:type II secretory pathway pseudopilin PulG